MSTFFIGFAVSLGVVNTIAILTLTSYVQDIYKRIN